MARLCWKLLLENKIGVIVPDSKTCYKDELKQTLKPKNKCEHVRTTSELFVLTCQCTDIQKLQQSAIIGEFHVLAKVEGNSPNATQG